MGVSVEQAIMKLARYRSNDHSGWGAVDGDSVIPLDNAWPSISLGLAAGVPALASAVAAASSGIPLSDVRLLKPVDDSARVFCVGLNYGRHVAETGRVNAAYPSIFLRTAQSLVGPSQPLAMPRTSACFDFEAELAVVIGKRGRRISLAEASVHVGGYTCMGEHSVRDYQKHSAQVTAGKNFDASGAIGPWIVTTEEIRDLAGLKVQGILNGACVQDGSISDLIFSVDALVAYISEFTELLPGDVIATGTPEGVGMLRTPPLYMSSGDVFEVTIHGVGTLRNEVADEADAIGAGA
jgi:2-keto-4-pentenoate hydratase/2-oxohepta-3-ene-1,7-dioic acid hydratase in catechol pathway